MSVFRRILFLVVYTTPTVVFAAARTFNELACEVVNIIDTATLTLIVFGLVVYFWGVVTSIPHLGDEKGAEKRKSVFFWGIIVLFIMFSIWGIVQILQRTLFGENYLDPGGGGPVC